MIHRFGEFELDEARGELRRAGEPVRMQPKPFELLRILVRERERIVTFDELHAALWPDTIVTPSSLTRAVSHARRAIGDTGRGEVIRSHARRGYRFCAQVVSAEAPPEATASAPVSEASESPFVGRGAVLAQLDAMWADAAAGRGGVGVIRGPAGIGKSRLAREFGRRARAAGARVLVGHGRQGEGVPALWIWTPILRELARLPQFAESLTPIFEQGEEFARWVPELADRIAAARGERAPDAGTFSAEERRFLLFEAASRSLEACSAQEPLLVLLEDLHWSSGYALRLFEHVALGVERCRALLLATVRDEAEPNAALRRSLTAVHGAERHIELVLDGLSRADVARLLGEAIDGRVPSELTSEVYGRTEGVPLFVREAIRLLGARGDLRDPAALARSGISLPMHAFDLIHRSLEALPSDALELVSVGAVIGRDFSVPLVASIADVDREQVLDGIDAAVAGGVLEPAEDHPGRFRFAHALFRDAAYERLGPRRRVRLHHQVAQRLVHHVEADPNGVLPELAHHLHQSLAIGDPDHALTIAERAAAHARALAADAQAAVHYEQALAALEHREPPDAAHRLALLNELAVVYGLSGDRDLRRARARSAMDLARVLDRPEAFARAAIAFCELTEWSPQDPDAEHVLHAALELLGEGDAIARAKLLVRLSYLEAGTKTPEVEARARQALAAARKSGDADTMQEGLFTLMYVLAGPDRLGERAELAGELADLAPSSGDRDPALVALIDSACDAIAEGRADHAATRRARAEAICGSRPHPSVAWHLATYDAGLALMEGRLDEGLERAQRAAELGRRISHPYANACFVGHLAEVQRWRGRADETLRLLERGVDRALGPTHWLRGLCGRAHRVLGNEGQAREYLASLAADEFRSIPRNIRWLNAAVEAAHLCAELEDREAAEMLLPLLEPVQDLHGVFCIPVNYGGPIAGALARLEALRGNRERALAYGRAAVASSKALGARPMEMRERRDLADLLTLRGDEGEAAEAAKQREIANQIASELSLEDSFRPGH